MQGGLLGHVKPKQPPSRSTAARLRVVRSQDAEHQAIPTCEKMPVRCNWPKQQHANHCTESNPRCKAGRTVQHHAKTSRGPPRNALEEIAWYSTATDNFIACNKCAA